MSKELLKHLGECAAYSAKGHFKTADIRRGLTYAYITVNFALSIICLTDLINSWWIKIFSVISLLSSILLLISETHGGMFISRENTKFANLYLEIHNDTYAEFLKNNSDEVKAEELKERYNALNKKLRPNISLGGKYWAKIAIEKFGEMNIWWK